MPKALNESKTIIFAVVWFVVNVANMAGFGGFEPSPELLEVFNALAPIIAFILRMKTDKPIEFKLKGWGR